MGQSKQSARKIIAADRRKDILQRRADGLTFKALAAEFQLSQRRVRQIVEQEFGRLNQERSEAALGAMDLAKGRLESLLEAVWDEAMEGDLAAVARAESLVMQQARLDGLGLAPKMVNKGVIVTGSSDLEKRAAALGLSLEKLRGPEPPSVPAIEAEFTALPHRGPLAPEEAASGD